MHQKSLAQLSRLLGKKEISSTELTKIFLRRIEQYDSQLNSFITIVAEQALKQAQDADDLISKNKAGPLTGIPFAHKDIFCTKGIKTSCGSKMLDNFISPYDATIVERIAKAGMVLVGKTNMDEFAMGSSNENSFYGPVRNPWDLETIPGGSSGGSAAAVAARLVPAATGSDTGGSIRQPAALCGVTGLKPTYGRVSRYGMIAFASSLDQAGPITQTAEDAAMLLGVMAGPDRKDSTCIRMDVPNYIAHLNDSLQGVKIGLPQEFFKDLNADVGVVIDEIVRQLEKLGAKFQPVNLPHIALSIPTYYIIAPAECSSNLARYDGVRYGYRCQDPKNLDDLYKRSRSEGFGDEVKRRIMIGTYVLSSGYYDAFYLKAQRARHLIQDDFINVFKDVNLILTPSTPSPAFKIGEKIQDPVSMYLNDIFTSAVNLAGLPALSMPAGFQGHLPIGAQLIGPHFAEAKILNVAHQYQCHTEWHRREPTAFK